VCQGFESEEEARSWHAAFESAVQAVRHERPESVQVCLGARRRWRPLPNLARARGPASELPTATRLAGRDAAGEPGGNRAGHTLWHRRLAASTHAAAAADAQRRVGALGDAAALCALAPLRAYCPPLHAA